ncbi:MAG: zf-HC2 domain-containing protein [Vicinamibacteria bacterium]
MRVETSCPADEDLAAFVEGKLEEPRRGRVVAHLTGCEDCREVVVETRRALSAEPPARPAAVSPAARAWLALAAATAVVALAGGVLVRGPSSPDAQEERSADETLAQSLRTREGWLHQPSFGSAAFAGSQSVRRVAFDLGALALDRRLASAAGLDDTRAAALESAALQLLRVDGGAPLADRLIEQARAARQGRRSPAGAGIEAALADSGLPREWFERGVRWERARLAAVVRFREGLDLAAVVLDAEGAGLSEASRFVRELRALAAVPVWQDQEWRSLDRALAGLMQLP